MRPSQPSIHTALREALANSFLADVSPATCRTILDSSVVARLRAGELFIEQYEAHRCAIAISGLLRVFVSLPDGRERTMAEVGLGGAVGIAAFSGRPNSASVSAIVDSHVLELDPRALTETASSDAPLAMALLHEVSRRLDDTQMLMTAELGPIRQRLARRLLDAAAETRDGPDLAYVSHAELAEQLGCSREWVTRSLSRLRADGLVASIRGRAIRVLDPIGLHLVAKAWDALDGAEEPAPPVAVGDQRHSRL